MKAIHVLRKPLVGTTVAANVLKYGCGGLNIDAARISTAGEEIKQVQSDPTNRTGTVGRDLGFTGAAVDAFREAQRASIERANRMGRWPANVVFQHLDGCEQTGVRKVKASAPASGPSLTGASTSTARGKFNGVGSTAYHGGEDGTETVLAYECAPGCPVAALDAQSGVSKSTGGRASIGAFKGGRAFGVGNGAEALPGVQPGLGDTGGASRFFKQF